MKLKQKKGQSNYGNVFIFMIMSFVIVVFFGIFYYGATLINTGLGEVGFDIGDTSFNEIVDDTWGEVFDAYSTLRILAYVLIFGMILTIFGLAWVTKEPPIFLIFYIMASLVGIIAAVYLSNAYQLLLDNPDFGSTLESFAGASYMLLYLPYLTAIVSLFSGLISLIGLNRSKREMTGVGTP